MTADTAPMPARPVAAKSAPALLTLDELDRRERPYRRYASILTAIESDLGGSGHISEAQRQIASRAAFLAMQLEGFEAKALSGGKVNLSLFGQLADRMRRLLESIGLERRAREVPDLQTYVRQTYGTEGGGE
jgi:hypothetical protein